MNFLPNSIRSMQAYGIIIAAMLVLSCSSADEESTAMEMTSATTLMSAQRLGQLIQKIDPEAQLQDSVWQFTIEQASVMVVYDESADRMRIVIPIKRADELDEDEMTRVLQANFDSALDARYALAQGVLWGVFIHPLSTLSDEEFLVGLGQTVNVVTSFGSSYSSGMFIFGGGDSAAIERRRLIDKLKEKAI